MNKKNAHLTTHSKKRSKKHLGFNRKATQRQADEAIKHGIHQRDATGRLAKYLDSLYFREETANNIRVYNRVVYIFIDDLLVTLYALPKNLHAQADKIQQRKQEEK